MRAALGIVLAAGVFISIGSGASSEDAKPRMYLVHIKVYEMNYQGNDAGKMKCLSKPRLGLFEGREGYVFTGQETPLEVSPGVFKTVQIGRYLRIAVSRRKNGKVRLAGELRLSRLDDEFAPAPKVIAETHRFDGVQRPGQFVNAACIMSGARKIWAEVMIEEVAPPGAGK